MSNFKHQETPEQNSVSNQSLEEDNSQTSSAESLEQMFLPQTFELIQTLPISFTDEPIGFQIFKFIQVSVNFWSRIIPRSQNEEAKYPMETLSEGAEYFAYIINQHNSQENIQFFSKSHNAGSLTNDDISELQFVPGELNQHQEKQNQNSDSSFQRFNSEKSPQISRDNKASDESLSNTDENLQRSEHGSQNTDSNDKAMVSLISECFELVHPPAEDTNISPFEKLSFIKTSLQELISSPKTSQSSERKFYIEILHNFDSSLPLDKLNNSKLLKSILKFSKSTMNDLSSLSTLLIGDHPKLPISTQIQQFLNLVKKEIQKKIKENSKIYKSRYFESILSIPLIPSYLQLINDFTLIYLHFSAYLHKIQSNIDNRNLSIDYLLSVAKVSYDTLGSSFDHIFKFICNSNSHFDLLNSAILVQNEIENIKQIISKYSDLDKFSLQELIQKLINRIQELNQKNSHLPRTNNCLTRIIPEIIIQISPNCEEMNPQNDLSVPDQLQSRFDNFITHVRSIQFLFDLNPQNESIPDELVNQIKQSISELRVKIESLIIMFSPSNQLIDIQHLSFNAIIELLTAQIQKFSICFYSAMSKFATLNQSKSLFDDFLAYGDLVSTINNKIQQFATIVNHSFFHINPYIEFFKSFAKIHKDILDVNRRAPFLFQKQDSFLLHIHIFSKQILHYFNLFDQHKIARFNQIYQIFGIGVKLEFPLSPNGFVSFISSIADNIIQLHDKSNRYERERKKIVHGKK
jgi:hypothetical protein